MTGLTADQAFYVTGGAILIIIGGAVAALRPRAPTALALAAFTGGLGLQGVVAILLTDGLLPAPVWWLSDVLVAVGCWGLLWTFPRRPTRAERASTLFTASAAAAVGASAILLQVATGLLRLPTAWGGPFAAPLGVTLAVLSNAGLAALVFVLPLRMRRMPADHERAARSLAFLAVGLLFFSAGSFASFASFARGELPLYMGIFFVTYIVVPTLLWVRATRGAHSGLAGAVVLAAATIYPASLLVGPDLGWAIGRVLGALILAYAVLRGEFAGLDLKARFAISRSTVAAAFIAVFFVTSEAAQQFLGDTLGSTYVGIAAAGALVFAIAPLQRAAERLAAKAVPVNSASIPDGAVGSTSSGGREAIFCRAVRLALRDGELSRDEERELVAIAFDLRLPPQRAFELRDEVVGKAQRVHLEETP